jgi:hypothetical protein
MDTQLHNYMDRRWVAWFISSNGRSGGFMAKEHEKLVKGQNGAGGNVLWLRNFILADCQILSVAGTSR